VKAVLVFIDGTICDGRQRYHLADTPNFYHRQEMLNDVAVPGSVQALQKLALRYEIVYIGSRPDINDLIAQRNGWNGQGFQWENYHWLRTRRNG
jgi:hypothetical protein